MQTTVDYHDAFPHVACKSHGGAYFDSDWEAGFEAGVMFGQLASVFPAEPSVPPAIGESRWVRTDNLEQIELIANAHGHAVRTEALFGIFTSIRLIPS